MAGRDNLRDRAAGVVANQVDPVQPEALAQVHVSWAIAVTDGSSRGGVPPCSGRSTAMHLVVPSTCSMTCRHSAPLVASPCTNTAAGPAPDSV